MASRRWVWLLGVLLAHGCASFPDTTDPLVHGLAREVLDPEPPRAADAIIPAAPEPKPGGGRSKAEETGLPPFAMAVSQKEPGPDRKEPVKRLLTIPEELPGAKAPPLTWPRDPAERAQAVKRLYPSLPPLPEGPQPIPGPTGQPLTLTDLQSLATANHPSIKNAVAGIKAAEGAVKQAGAYPNPTLAWEADTVGTTSAGYQGAYVDQVIKGGNDLKLKTAAAMMDLRNAQLALRKARSDLATQVRSSYFGVLVAWENIKVSRALARFTGAVYRVQVDLLAAGEAAPYEPMQLRPLAGLARFNLIQAQNQYLAAWKQLANNLGLPNMPPTQLAGSVDLPVPVFDYDAVREYVSTRHTDVLTALNNAQKARYLLELAKVAPFPDFDVRVLVQKDYTTPPFLLVYSAVVGFQLPVWDLNRGNVMQAKNQLTQAFLSPTQSKLQLLNTLADAYNRYLTAKEQAQTFRQAIEDQVRVYRGVYERRSQAPDQVSFGDVVTAQQTLANYITTYITALGLQWTAVVDLANLLQTDNLFQVARTEDMAPVPDLDHLLPCPGPSAGACPSVPAASVGHQPH
jgi:cobalt-zinc-cadmium efflux system outer membrane protein